MHPRSTSSFSSGASETVADRKRASDIIDLDQYMRARVRHYNEDRGYNCNSINKRGVVDTDFPCKQSVSSDSSSERQDKIYSIDSGLSDPTYRWKYRSNREPRQRHSKVCDRRDSLLLFRMQWEKSLQEQKEQIDRVAKLCEYLATKDNHRTLRKNRTPTEVSYTADTSDLTTLSVSSTKERRNGHRTDGSGTTYKMIMHKLDDLNKLFIARRATPRVIKRCTSDSVSTSVKTASLSKRRILVERGVGDVPSINRRKKSRISSLQKTNLHAVDIAPTETITKGTRGYKDYSSIESSSVIDQHHDDTKMGRQRLKADRPRSICTRCSCYWRWLQQLFLTDVAT